MNYVAYIHAKPDTEDFSGIFYVGKGTLRRAKKVVRNESSNRHYKHTVAKYGAENILIGVMECSSEEIALELERGLIKCFRRMGSPLVNLTDGGEGSSGYSPTDETRERLSLKARQMWENPEVRGKILKAQRASGGNASRSEAKIAASLRNAEKARHVLATEKKEQGSRKNSEKSTTMWAVSEFKEAMKQKHSARWTLELRNAKGEDVRGRIRITNGEEERNVRPEEVDAFLSLGWRRGRKPRKSSKRT